MIVVFNLLLHLYYLAVYSFLGVACLVVALVDGCSIYFAAASILGGSIHLFRRSLSGGIRLSFAHVHLH